MIEHNTCVQGCRTCGRGCCDHGRGYYDCDRERATYDCSSMLYMMVKETVSVENLVEDVVLC